jgi:hypothetical protein
MGPGEDKRDTERVEILGELKGEVTILQPMVIKGVGRGGAHIETTFPLQVDSLHEFRLILGDRSLVVKGRIAHCTIVEVEDQIVVYRSGVEFIEPPDRIDSAIAGFLDAIAAGRRAP